MLCFLFLLAVWFASMSFLPSRPTLLSSKAIISGNGDSTSSWPLSFSGGTKKKKSSDQVLVELEWFSDEMAPYL